MSANAVGVDIVEIERVALALALGRFGERFLQRVYTPIEVAACRGRVHELSSVRAQALLPAFARPPRP